MWPIKNGVKWLQSSVKVTHPMDRIPASSHVPSMVDSEYTDPVSSLLLLLLKYESLRLLEVGGSDFSGVPKKKDLNMLNQ